MRLSNAVADKMFPHFLATLQWTLLVVSLAFNLNFSVAVTGAMANDGLKVIMLFHFWMLFSSAVLCLSFYRMRKEGVVERFIASLSIIALAFSIGNIILHFVNGFAVLMKALEVIAWSLYNSIISASAYKISIRFLWPALRRFADVKEEDLRNNEKL